MPTAMFFCVFFFARLKSRKPLVCRVFGYGILFAELLIF